MMHESKPMRIPLEHYAKLSVTQALITEGDEGYFIF